MTATERGRWFLTEYANRNRGADTDQVVAAIARIEAAICGASAAASAIADELPRRRAGRDSALIARTRCRLSQDHRRRRTDCRTLFVPSAAKALSTRSLCDDIEGAGA